MSATYNDPMLRAIAAGNSERELATLRAENARLRETLTWAADYDENLVDDHDAKTMVLKARATLKSWPAPTRQVTEASELSSGIGDGIKQFSPAEIRAECEAAFEAEKKTVLAKLEEARAARNACMAGGAYVRAQRDAANTLLREARELLGVSHLTRNNELRARIAKHLGD